MGADDLPGHGHAALAEGALGGLTAPDVQRVYTRLLKASQRHLAAFEGRAVGLSC